MPVLIDRIDHLDINCLIYIGKVSQSDVLGFPSLIDASTPEFGCTWISYFHPMADLSNLDAGCLLALRERLRPVVAALSAKGEFRMILVSHSKYNDPLIAVWKTMVGTDAAYSSNPMLLHDVRAAARALGFSEADAEQARIWMELRTAQLSTSSR